MSAPLRRLVFLFSASIGVALTLAPLLGLALGALQPDLGKGGGFDARSGELLLTTIALGLATAASTLVLGTWLAWVEQRASYPGVRALGVLGILPLAIPSYVLAGTLRSSLSGSGEIGGLLGIDRFTGWVPAWIVLTLATLPYVQLLIGAALARAPAAEEEAARSLGAGPWRVFRQIVLPRVRPALGFAGLLAALYAISDFGAVAMLQCPVLTWRLYQAVDLSRYGEALTLGVALLVATLPLLLAARWVRGGEAGRGGAANPRPAARRPLRGVGLALTYSLHALVIGLGVLVPVLTLCGWVGSEAGDAGFFKRSIAPLGGPLVDTLGVALLGGVVTVLLAWGPAWLASEGAQRGETQTARRGFWIEQAVYLTSALPGVLLAFGLLLLSLSVARAVGGESSGALYASLKASGLLLMAGYATRFLAEAFAGLRTAIGQVDPRQDESARALGVSTWRRWSQVWAPSLAPGVSVAFVLTTLAIVKELPVTLLLGANAMGLRTLSFRLYDRYTDAFLADAGLAGLLLVGLALVAVVVSLRWRRHA